MPEAVASPLDYPWLLPSPWSCILYIVFGNTLLKAGSYDAVLVIIKIYEPLCVYIMLIICNVYAASSQLKKWMPVWCMFPYRSLVNGFSSRRFQMMKVMPKNWKWEKAPRWNYEQHQATRVCFSNRETWCEWLLTLLLCHRFDEHIWTTDSWDMRQSLNLIGHILLSFSDDTCVNYSIMNMSIVENTIQQLSKSDPYLSLSSVSEILYCS